MIPLRIIARLDIKGPNLIKGVQMEGLRVVGDPHEFAVRYYREGIDEIIYTDTVASLYGRNNLTDVLERTARDVFIPITAGGGVRSTSDVEKLLKSGADKVSVNTAAIAQPQLIQEIAREFGSQCMVLSIEAKKGGPGQWSAYTDNGREKTGLDVVEWAKRAVDLGAGEILLTSVDRDGTRSGFDVDLVHAVATRVSVPVIASGGMGTLEHATAVVEKGRADAVAVAYGLHYGLVPVSQIREAGHASRVAVRAS